MRQEIFKYRARIEIIIIIIIINKKEENLANLSVCLFSQVLFIPVLDPCLHFSFLMNKPSHPYHIVHPHQFRF